MYRIMNSSKRSFIVKATEVLKGGTNFAYTPKDGEKAVILAPGQAVYEVVDELGKQLETYQGIVIVEKVKEKTKKGK